MAERFIGDSPVGAIGLGCMCLSHAYGMPPREPDAVKLLQQAVDVGVKHFDTAALYGFGANETVVGKALAPHRQTIHLASKCGMTGVNGKRVIDGRPETLKATCERSLARLQTDYIDLYYLHRWDKAVPIEDSIGALADLVREGKIGAIGLSEVSAETLQNAYAVHPVAAVQTEYSLWTRNAELAVLDTCRELGITFVAFSPLARGFLTGRMVDPQLMHEKDIRRGMPRFQEPYFSENNQLLIDFLDLATEAKCTPGQLALSWLLAQSEHIVAIPGTTNAEHLQDNMVAEQLAIEVDPSVETIIQ